LAGFTAIGVAAFVYGALLGDGVRAWGVLLVNFLFWSGLAHAGVLFSALQEVTSARWGRSIKRIAEATCAFLPVAFLILLVLFAGVSTWAPWVSHPVEARQSWLNVPFLIARQGIGFLVLSALSLAYVYHSVRPDLGLLSERGGQDPDARGARITAGWRGMSLERSASSRWQGRLAPALLVVYAIVFSLQAFDFVMSLDPEWISTLVGGYFFVGNLYIGIAFLAVATVWCRSRLNLDEWVGHSQLHDLGKLLFGFSMLWAYLAWSQYLVIWYGDLPEETAFIARRLVDSPWAPLGWAVFVTVFVAPFLVLLSRAVKRHPPGLLAIALVALGGMWLERFVLVVPSLWRGGSLPLGAIELFITAGFGASFFLCYCTFLRTVPVLPVSDPLLAPADDRHSAARR
jgi:hypothetical protein